MSQDEVSEQADTVQVFQQQILNITLLASEWKSSAGGLSTLSKELAIYLAQIQNVKVSLLVPEGACNDEDKREAEGFRISILDARKCVALEPLLWLINPPQDHKMDVIVGHGLKLGCQVQLIKRQAQFQNCKWVHLVHILLEDLGYYKAYSDPISRGEKKLWNEVGLCKCADLVVPVGPMCREAFHSCLMLWKKEEDFFELIPGLFEREFGHLAAKQKPKDEKVYFIVLLCGCGDEEDFEVKRYNIAFKAFANQRLKGKHYSLLFVGSPEGKQDEVKERLVRYFQIDEKQLSVRAFVKSRERMKDLFCQVDMVIMPSRSKGFGLVALQALSAGLPILVGRNSGFATAIKGFALGSYRVVDSEDPAEWAEAIQRVRDGHSVVLKENKILKERYAEKYCWKTQCEELVGRMRKMVYGTSAAQAIAADDLVEQCASVVTEPVCLPDPTTMQQLIGESAVTSSRGKGFFIGTEIMSQHKVSEEADTVQNFQRQILNITLLASEWKSSAGGLSTLNRELAIHLAQIQNVKVSVLIPEGAYEGKDKSEAEGFRISILDARKCVALEPLLWLSKPPQDHKIDVIVGHDVKLGYQVQLIKGQAQFQNCKWVHVVHTAPEDLGKYKGYSSPISRGEEKHWDAVDLCRCADLVVPVGPKLKEDYQSYLCSCKEDEDFFELIPGLFEREFGDLVAKQNPKDEKDDFIVLLCGRGDEEDFELKGYKIAVEAFADQRLKEKHCFLLFVGSPEGKQGEIKGKLLKYGNGNVNERLTVREFVKSREKMKELFCSVDMVIMPSKSEGFGLVALEALSAGLPILVGRNSGFASAIKGFPSGSYRIVDSEDPAKWAEAIQDVRDRHSEVLQENIILKEHYATEYCWKTQCEKLVDRLWKMV